MVRHDLFAGAISPAPRGMFEAAAPAALIAPRGLPTPHPAGVDAATSGAVDLAPVATTANQDLLAAEDAEEEAAAAAVVEIATAPYATFNPWTRSASGAMMPLQSCSGTVWGAAPRSLPSSAGAAPGPMIDRDFSVSGAALSAIERRPKLSARPHRGLTRWVHRAPVPCASLRANRPPLRGRVPPWTIGTTRCAEPKRSPPPNKRGSGPPSTPVALQDFVAPTAPPIVAAAMCIKPRGLLTEAQAVKVDQLKEISSDFAIMRQFAMRFRGLLKGSDPEPLDEWLREATNSGIHGMCRFTATLRRDLAAVRNAISTPWSKGQTEGQINRLKTLKRSMYGRAGVELLRARMLPYDLRADHTL